MKAITHESVLRVAAFVAIVLLLVLGVFDWKWAVGVVVLGSAQLCWERWRDAAR